MSQETPPLLRFHSVHSKNITLSQDKTIARRTHDFGFVFTSQPIQPDEKITIKFMEVSNRSALAAAFCFGITHKNPTDEPFEDVRNYTYLDLIKKMGFVALPLDKKLCSRNAIFAFKVTSSGELVFEVNGEGKNVKFDGKINTKVEMWGLVYFFENPVCIKLIRGLPQGEKREERVEDNGVVKVEEAPTAPAEPENVDERRTSIFGVVLKRVNSQTPSVDGEDRNGEESRGRCLTTV